MAKVASALIRPILSSAVLEDAVRDALPECLDCGACCFSTLPTYLRLSGDDYERLGHRAEELSHFIGNRCFMKMVGGRCAALVIDPDAKRFICSVYEARPSTCRELRRGSPECEGERDAKGKRPLIAAESLLQGGPTR